MNWWKVRKRTRRAKKEKNKLYVNILHTPTYTLTPTIAGEQNNKVILFIAHSFLLYWCEHKLYRKKNEQKEENEEEDAYVFVFFWIIWEFKRCGRNVHFIACELLYWTNLERVAHLWQHFCVNLLSLALFDGTQVNINAQKAETWTAHVSSSQNRRQIYNASGG